MKRDSFIVYKSFFALIKLLPTAAQRLKMHESIYKYSLSEIEPKFADEDSEAVWSAIMPQLRANNRRYENGLKGGAPKGNDNAKKTTEDSEIKQPKNNLETTNGYDLGGNEQTTKKQPNENENVNDNVNVNENKVSKKVSKEERNINNIHACESYDTILDDFGVTGAYREAIFSFIAHLHNSFKIHVPNDRLENIVIALDRNFLSDREKVIEIKSAIVKGYKHLDCETERL